MLKVRKKTLVDSASQWILRMDEAGIPLSWDRYEEQLPLCGFTQNGLNCSACLQGPCRISPFGDKPDRGTCGADGRQIIMHNLLEKVRRGAMDHLTVLLENMGEEGAEKCPSTEFTARLRDRLPQSVAQRLKERGALPSNLLMDVTTARDPFFVDPGMFDATAKSILRLGACSLLASMAISQVKANGAGTGGLSPGSASTCATILLDGAVRRAVVDSLEQAIAQEKDIRLVGTAGNGWLHASGSRLFSPGSPELAVASGLVDCVLQSDVDGYPSLAEMCHRMGIPRFTVAQQDGSVPDAAAIVAKAKEHYRRRRDLSAGMSEEFAVQTEAWKTDTGKLVRKAIEKQTARGVVLLVGGTNVRQTYFERTTKVMKGLLANDVILLTAGDAAGGALLFDSLKDAAGPQLRKLFKGQPRPWFSLGSVYESGRALDVLGFLAGDEGFTKAPVAAAFLEIPSFAYLASAFGWLAMGLPTQIATPLPLWGNRELTRWMTDEAEAHWGAPLLASPAMASPDEQVNQILQQLDAGK